jgi:ADP-heptose:LPS heptosyltransferase
MHILRNSEPIGSLQPGEWLFHDTNAFEMALRARRGTCDVSPFWQNRTPWSFLLRNDQPPKDYLACKSILLIRSGAIGDLLMLSACIEPLRLKFPNAMIHLSHNERHMPVTRGFNCDPAVYPMPLGGISGYDLIIPLENVVENATEKGQHGIDAYAEAIGITITDYRPIYKVTEQEAYDANYRFPRPAIGGPVKRRPRIALQLQSSSRIRDYHMAQWGKVVNLLLEKDWEIMLIGNKNPDTSKMGIRVRDCSALSFREAAAVLAQCDVFCGVDSSFFNLCPALDVPAVGLFGPVDSRTRAIEALGQHTLDGVGKCAPCGWTNSRAGQPFPAHGPCSQLGYCVPLSQIEPEAVVKKILEVRKP